jgi:hypothetical protein
MTIRLIFTTSIISPEREALYVQSIKDTMEKISSIPVVAYVVENNGQRETLLDSIEGVTTVYTNTNTIQAYERKGMKELIDILYVGNTYRFEDEDIVIKLTGRYTLRSAKFFEEVYDKQGLYDCFIKCYNVCTNQFLKDDCVLGLYGLRWKYFEDINYMRMLDHQSMEHVFITEVRNLVAEEKILEVEHLDMCFRGDTDCIV